jgi:hypothetical protein
MELEDLTRGWPTEEISMPKEMICRHCERRFMWRPGKPGKIDECERCLTEMEKERVRALAPPDVIRKVRKDKGTPRYTDLEKTVRFLYFNAVDKLLADRKFDDDKELDDLLRRLNAARWIVKAVYDGEPPDNLISVLGEQ